MADAVEELELPVAGFRRWSPCWKRREDAEPLAFSYSVFDVGVFALCAASSVAYAVTKKWYLNNLLGCAFAIQGIQMLALGSYAIGCILLSGLFLYDIFSTYST